MSKVRNKNFVTGIDMPELISSRQSELLLDVLYSKLDGAKLADSEPLPNEVLTRELKVVIDRLMDGFPHWDKEQKSDAKLAALEYINVVDRAELVAEIKKRYPKQNRPLGQRILNTLFFGVFGALTILLTPLFWLLSLCDKCFSKRELGDDEMIIPRFQILCESSRMLAEQLWPAKCPECYCCPVEGN